MGLYYHIAQITLFCDILTIWQQCFRTSNNREEHEYRLVFHFSQSNPAFI